MFKKSIVVFTFVLYPLIVQAGLFAYQDKKTDLWGFNDSQGRVVVSALGGCMLLVNIFLIFK